MVRVTETPNDETSAARRKPPFGSEGRRRSPDSGWFNTRRPSSARLFAPVRRFEGPRARRLDSLWSLDITDASRWTLGSVEVDRRLGEG